MSVSGARAAVEINLDEFERRLRAAGASQMGMEDPLAELARLVEMSKAAAANVAPGPGRMGREPAPPAEAAPPVRTAPLRPALGEAKDDGPIEKQPEPVEPPQVEDAKDFLGNDPKPTDPKTSRGASRWKLTASALALAGAAMIGAVFLLRGGVPGLPKAPPFIAAAQGPTKVKPPSDETVAASNDAGASLMKDAAPPAQVKVVNSEEQPVDLSVQAALPVAPPPVASAPTTTGSTQPPPADAFASAAAAAPGGSPVAATVNTPVVAPAPPAPPPLASQFPDPRPVRTVSLRPDGTPIPTPASPAAETAQPSPSPSPEPQARPGKPAPKATKNDAAGIAQPSTPKLELPAKPAKSSARVVVAKTDTTAPGVAETPSQPLQLGGPAKAEKAPKPPKPAQAAAEPPAAAPAAPAPPAQQPDNPIAHAFSSLVGGPAAPAPQPVDPTAATSSGGWTVQLAAPKSETEAKSDLARLNAKYATALNGSTIGVHKASVNGETVYRLRVVGLTKADAAALCARLKGDGGDCFIAR